MKLVATLAVVLVACNSPTFSIEYFVDESTCGTDSCSDVTINCRSWVNVRIISPADPTRALASICQPVREQPNNLCSIARNKFDSTEPDRLPSTPLQIQVSVWPESMIDLSDPANPVCPGSMVEWAAENGFPKDGSLLMPAIGGSKYIQGDDPVAEVKLQCSNLTAINSCIEDTHVTVNATVQDFDTRVSVGSPISSNLEVSVGEPALQPDSPIPNLYLLNGTVPLKSDGLPTPTWSGELDEPLASYACIEVTERIAQTTATVVCDEVPAQTPYSLHGIRVSKRTLDDVLALTSGFPADSGLTLGIVVDYQGNPKTGISVVPFAPGTATPDMDVQMNYLDATRKAVVTGMTSPSGIFFTTTAPFGTRFRAAEDLSMFVEEIGGGIDNKVTVVILQLPPPSSGLQ